MALLYESVFDPNIIPIAFSNTKGLQPTHPPRWNENPPELEIKRGVQGGVENFEKVHSALPLSPFGDSEPIKGTTINWRKLPGHPVIWLANNEVQARPSLVSEVFDTPDLKLLNNFFQGRNRGRFDKDVMDLINPQCSIKSIPSSLGVSLDRRIEVESPQNFDCTIETAISFLFQNAAAMPKKFPTVGSDTQSDLMIALAACVVPRTSYGINIWIPWHRTIVQFETCSDVVAHMCADKREIIERDLELEPEVKALFTSPCRHHMGFKQRMTIAKAGMRILSDYLDNNFSFLQPSQYSKVERALIAAALKKLEQAKREGIRPSAEMLRKTERLQNRFSDDVCYGLALLTTNYRTGLNATFRDKAGLATVVQSLIKPEDILPANTNRQVILYDQGGRPMRKIV